MTVSDVKSGAFCCAYVDFMATIRVIGFDKTEYGSTIALKILFLCFEEISDMYIIHGRTCELLVTFAMTCDPA